MNMKNKPLKISKTEDLIKMMNQFYLKKGINPRAILTTKENVQILTEWFMATPDCLEINFRGVPILTPEQIMII